MGWISTNEAVRRVKAAGLGSFTTHTIRGWGRRYKLGRKLGGRWIINEERLAQFMGRRGAKDGIRKEEGASSGSNVAAE